jgi:hypothetical protein
MDALYWMTADAAIVIGGSNDDGTPPHFLSRFPLVIQYCIVSTIRVFATSITKMIDGIYHVVHCKEPKQKIRNKYSQKRNKYSPRKELRGQSANFHIHVSVSDLYIPMIDLPIFLQEIYGKIQGFYKSLTDT